MMMVKGSSLTVMGSVLVVAASISGGWGRLVERAFDTNATCSAPTNPATGNSWQWMDNAQHKSPCLTASYLLGPCVSAGYLVVSLSNGQEYTPPVDSKVSACACSWAVYNLLMGCTLCQGQQNSIVSWFQWSANCGNFTSTNSPYPTTPPDNTTIPNWAGLNPATNWTDQRWSGQEAYAQATLHPGDMLVGPVSATPTPTPTPTAVPKPKSGNNVGAIAGGVVGGVAVIAVGIVLALFLFCRNKRRKSSNQTQMTEATGGSHFDLQHARSPSDFSTKTYGSGLGYAPLAHSSSPSTGSTNRLLQSPTTFHTHNSSRGSFAHESLLAPTVYPATPPPPALTSPPNVYMTPHGAVSPFTLDRPSTPQETPSNQDSKRAISPTSTSGTSTRGPMNPPAYSEAPHVRADFSSQAPDQSSIYGSTSIMTTPNAQSRRPHEKGPSVDSTASHRSDTSSTSAGYWTHATTTSLSGAAVDMLSQMDSVSQSGGPTTPPYAGPGPSVSVQHTRDEKRRPTVMNPSSGPENSGSGQQR